MMGRMDKKGKPKRGGKVNEFKPLIDKEGVVKTHQKIDDEQKRSRAAFDDRNRNRTETKGDRKGREKG